MQPFVHAQASARGTGRSWQEDLPIHEFMDLAKHACPDLRHRLVLHNADLGPELAAMAFPDRSDARSIAQQHVRQDVGWLPTLSDWLALVDASMVPPFRKASNDGEDLIKIATEHLKLASDMPIRQVWGLLTLPERFAPDHSPLASLLLLSSLGPIMARAVLGAPRSYPQLDGRETIVDFSWVAEGMIVARIGAIHSLERVLKGFDGQEPRCRHGAASKDFVVSSGD